MLLRYFSLSLCVLLYACAGVPSLPDESRVSVEQIINLTKCELRDALLYSEGGAPWLATWSASAELTLKVNSQATAGLGAPTFLTPIQLGTFAATFDASIGENANGVAKIKFSTKLKDTRNQLCPLPADRTDGSLMARRTLGIAAWLNRAIDSAKAANVAESTRSLAYTIEFVVTANGSVLPKWDLLYSNKNKFGIGPKLFGEIKDTHIVDLALAPPPGKPDPIEVIIVADKTASKGAEKLLGPRRGTSGKLPSTGPGVDPRSQRELDNILNGLQGERRFPDLDR